MSFKDTYSHEVLQSRQDRSRRAFFWARIVGFALMITIAATLRADPELRGFLMRAGMDGVMQMADVRTAPRVQNTLPAQSAPTSSQLPKARIKINRPEPTPLATQTQDAGALAQELGRAMAAQPVGN